MIDNIILKDLEKSKKIIDMMATMHSVLSNKYRILSFILDALLIIFSLILLSCVFIDPALLNNIGVDANISRIIIGAATILVTCMSFFPYILDWKGKKNDHDQAFTTLINLKSKWRIFLLDKNNHTNDDAIKLEEEKSLILQHLIIIDDSKFNKLKKKHYMKVYISRMTSNYPAIPIFLIKIWLFIRDIKSLSSLNSNKRVKNEDHQ
ncbi:hypothetical protein FACS189468_1220 [Spirochaetia bacterium]|nr:hypothetical protein FACS189468_1220 [Spirochaetia bacterium]